MAVFSLVSYSVAVFVYLQWEVLWPLETFIAHSLCIAFHALFILFIASWAAIFYNGPGRVPPPRVLPDSQPSLLPPDFASALTIGRFHKERQFGPSDGWCGKCNYWKPPLAHHCSQCGKCSMWMDHHCNCSAQCVGFRNLRCFIVWLSYACGLHVVIFLTLLARMWSATSLGNAWALVRMLLFGFSICISLGRSWRALKSTYQQVSSGWPSYVLLVKFEAVIMVVEGIIQRAEAKQANTGAEPPEIVKELRRACTQLILESCKCQGLFGTSNAGLLASLTNVFGERRSWKWLLPFRSGGAGDPLQPRFYDSRACASWSQLAELLAKFYSEHGTERCPQGAPSQDPHED